MRLIPFTLGLVAGVMLHDADTTLFWFVGSVLAGPLLIVGGIRLVRYTL